MNKENIIVVIISIIVIIGAIFTAVIIKNNSMDQKENKVENKEILIEEVSDECTEEYKTSLLEEIKEVNSYDEKLSANARLVLKKYYKKCDHTINEYVEMPTEFVNMTEEDIKKEYQEWEIIGFSPEEVILYKEIDDKCDEHFLLKLEDGKVVIYKVLEDGTNQLYEKTDIAAEYLPEVDLLNMDGGLEIYGKESLNQILEDFE